MLAGQLRGMIAGLVAGVVAMGAAPAAQAEDVLVFAAASLTNAMNDIGEQFAARTGNRMTASYAASSALAKQIEQGAPAQLFASADLKWMDYLAEKKLIDPASRSNLLGNALVVVVPADSGRDRIEIGPQTDFVALAGQGRIATGDPDSVPVGLYFRQAMEQAGQWKAVEPKVARAESVRAALALVERGEVAYGVVYATDAAISKTVKVIGAFPDSMHDPVIYPVALIAGRATPAGQALLDYLHGPEARAVFTRYGFTVH